MNRIDVPPEPQANVSSVTTASRMRGSRTRPNASLGLGTELPLPHQTLSGVDFPSRNPPFTLWACLWSLYPRKLNPSLQPLTLSQLLPSAEHLQAARSGDTRDAD